MMILVVASLAFLITHLGVSSTPLRGILINSIGEKGYLGLYSLMAFITLGFMIYAYGQVPHADFIWAPSKELYALAKVLMPLSFILVVSGLMAKNPTAVGQADAVNQEVAPIFRITRHPVQWGILLWAVSHLAANGDVASIVFFGTFAVLSSFGMMAMDAKYRAKEGDAWKAFFGQTSYVPFAALVAGRTSLKISDLNWIAVAIGVVVTIAVYMLHDWIGGVPLY